jgi:hypothetical protein
LGYTRDHVLTSGIGFGIADKTRDGGRKFVPGLTVSIWEWDVFQIIASLDQVGNSRYKRYDLLSVGFGVIVKCWVSEVGIDMAR